jgi:hypothetical protein
MDLLNLFIFKREVKGGVGINGVSDVIEVGSGGLRAVELVMKIDVVALPLYELRISDLAVRATMVFTAATAAPYAAVFEGMIGGYGGFPPLGAKERRR